MLNTMYVDPANYFLIIVASAVGGVILIISVALLVIAMCVVWGRGSGTYSTPSKSNKCCEFQSAC